MTAPALQTGLSSTGTVFIPVAAVVVIIWLHFLSDFLLQSDSMARNKSKSNWWLLYHVLVYSAPLLLFQNLGFWLVNFLGHFLTDYITSRITSKFWKGQRVHDFFVVIGFDQAIHMTTLIISAYYFLC